jgi:hypothetical protein
VGLSFVELEEAKRRQLGEFLYVTIPRFQERQSKRSSEPGLASGRRNLLILGPTT